MENSVTIFSGFLVFRQERLMSINARQVWPLYGALIGLIGGALAPLFGSLFIAISWLIDNNSSGFSLHGLGSILLLSTIPLLIFGASCLDLFESRGRKEIK